MYISEETTTGKMLLKSILNHQKICFHTFIQQHMFPRDYAAPYVPWGSYGRVGNSVKNSTDTIFELEILAQEMRAKIRINVQK